MHTLSQGPGEVHSPGVEEAAYHEAKYRVYRHMGDHQISYRSAYGSKCQGSTCIRLLLAVCSFKFIQIAVCSVQLTEAFLYQVPWSDWNRLDSESVSPQE